MENKNSVLPQAMKLSNQTTPADLKNLVLYTTTKVKDESRCEAYLEEDRFQIRKLQSNGRHTVLSEWCFDDFIGLEVHMHHETYMDQGHLTLRPIGTKYDSSFCSAPNKNKKVIVEGKCYHAASDEIIHAVRNIIMTAFWDYLKKKHGAGIPEDDTSYVHPKNLKPWEKKALVYINPFAGSRQAGKQFHSIERYLRAFGFVLDQVVTYRQNQVKEEMALMEGSTFKNYYCRLVFSGDGLIHELINGYYDRNDHEELKLRMCAFPGGSRNCASYMSQWSYGLEQVDPINALWACTRMHFEPLSITKYTTNGPEETIYGFHDSCIGLLSDIVATRLKQKNLTVEEQLKLKQQCLKDPKHRNLKISYIGKTTEDYPEPKFDEEVPENWTTIPCEDTWSVVLQQFPIWTHRYEFTRRLKVGDHYGEFIVIDHDKNDCEGSKATLSKWFNSALAKDNSACSVEKVQYNLISGYKIEILDKPDNVDNMYFMLDGECHVGNKIQCCFINQNRILLGCHSRPAESS